MHEPTFPETEIAARLAAIVASSEDAIISKDLNGIIQSWNQGAERMFAFAAEEVIGRSITIIIPDDRLIEETEVLRRIRLGEPIRHFETVRRAKTGQLIDVSLSVSPVRNAAGVIVGASKIARDITEQKRLRREAEEAHRLKDEFLATLSHELRTPLNAVIGWAQMLQREQLAPETLRKSVEAILRNARSQAVLIEDLLDVSRIVSGRLHFSMEEIALAPVVRETLEEIEPTATGKQVRLDHNLEEIRVRGDRGRLRQVVSNLLSNAVKFTPANGRVVVTLQAAGSQAVLTVSDSGQGISPEFLPHVFERFRQEDASTRRSAPGLGLGLSITRHIVEAHGGTIEAASAGRGEGATFTVRLPRRA